MFGRIGNTLHLSTIHNAASLSNENLTTPISANSSTNRLYRMPSLPKNHNKSGIPVPTIHRDLSHIALRGLIDS